MTETLNTFIYDHLFYHILIVVICTASLILSMGVDLFFGIQKARQNGEAKTSTGLKKTCEKARKYFSPFLCLICIDVVASPILPVPAFSMLWTVWCDYCEFTSVREKAWKKAELRKAERTMSLIIENKEDIAKMVAELITKTNLEKEIK